MKRGFFAIATVVPIQRREITMGVHHVRLKPKRGFKSDDGAIMALSHKRRPIFGIQFHPESYGTAGGDQIIINFLDEAQR